jgi:iron complex transport system ATP-binding protein
MSALLELRGVGFAFGRGPRARPALRDLDLSLAAGDFLGVVGPNGGGKTTLLKLMAGLLPPSTGTLLLQGQPLAALTRRQRARRIAMVSQTVPATFDYRGLDLVLLGRSAHLGPLKLESRRDLAAAEAALRSTDALAFADRPLRTLSGGELQRVLIATALAQETELLLLDEPTTHLDLKHRVELYHLLGRLHDRGKTIVLVSHDLNLIAERCTRVLLLRQGRSLGCGAPEEMFAPERLRRALEVEVLVDRSPISGRPRVTVAGVDGGRDARPTEDGGRAARFTRFRDLTLLRLGEQRLVVACDSLGGIGPLPEDSVRVEPEVVGYGLARVVLLELAAVRATPILIADLLACAAEPYGRRIMAGIARHLEEIGLDPAGVLTGSTEENVPVRATGAGIVALGVPLGAELLIEGARDGDFVVLLGVPRVGAEVDLASTELPSFELVGTLAGRPGVHEIIPLGSGGVAGELGALERRQGLRLRVLDPLAGSTHSAGPATAVLLCAADVRPLEDVPAAVPSVLLGRLERG